MARLPLYYVNIIGEHGGRAHSTGTHLESVWAEIEKSIGSLEYFPKKMYHDGIFTYNNTLLVIPPKDVPRALSDIYNMPEGHSKRMLIRLAGMGTSLVPCEEHELFMAWRKNETELSRKEEAGEEISAEEIGQQAVYLLTRNKVIGQVIAQTLTEDEAGVLFLGVDHNLKGMMADNYLRDTLGFNVIELNPLVRQNR
jgi:hypothetical protein